MVRGQRQQNQPAQQGGQAQPQGSSIWGEIRRAIGQALGAQATQGIQALSRPTVLGELDGAAADTLAGMRAACREGDVDKAFAFKTCGEHIVPAMRQFAAAQQDLLPTAEERMEETVRRGLRVVNETARALGADIRDADHPAVQARRALRIAGRR